MVTFRQKGSIKPYWIIGRGGQIADGKLFDALLFKAK
jgi:hypothetical protein